MPELSASVGEGGTNKTHDVALVQAMLRQVKNAKNVPYLNAPYDGVYTAAVKTAIAAFNTDQKMTDAGPIPVGPAAKNFKPGPAVMGPAGHTLKKLNQMLAAPYDKMRAIEGHKTVYIAGADADAATSKANITGDQNLEPAWRATVGNLVANMFATHKIVLWLTPTGSRRTFAQQAAEVNTKAGPGESHHNYGRAIDIGFKHFQWVQATGAIKKDADWLNSLEATSAAKANAFWDTRDALAKPLNMHRLKFERVHLQAFDDGTVSARKSLAKLLTTAGAMKWEAVAGGGYKADLGLGGALHAVGTAKQVWAGNATVDKKMAAAFNKVAEAKVTAKEIKAVQTALKKDFESADANWLKWAAVAP